jgi:formamidase
MLPIAHVKLSLLPALVHDHRRATFVFLNSELLRSEDAVPRSLPRNPGSRSNGSFVLRHPSVGERRFATGICLATQLQNEEVDEAATQPSFFRATGGLLVETLIPNEPFRPMEQQKLPGHNRWHPDIPSVAKVRPGDRFRVECSDMLDWQIRNDDDASDIRNLDMSRAHMLSGPIAVEGASAGDVLVVEVLDVGPLRDAEWGYTGIMPPEMGGILSDYFVEPRKAIWDLEGIYAVSRHVPGVRFAGQIHPGVIGVAPSHELLQKWNAREKELLDSDPDRVPAFASAPTAEGAVLSTLSGGALERVGDEAARTLPGRENGGNCDIKNISKGSKLYLPVFVDEAKLSVGDIHFSLADGEITVCGAIEMAGYLDLRVDVIPDGMRKFGLNNPFFITGPIDFDYSERVVFEGFSVDTEDGQHYLDPHASFRQASLEAIRYLQRFGYSAEQAYLILTTAPIESRISALGGKPNAVCTVAVPTGIFEGDIRPGIGEPSFKVSGADLARAR